MCSRREFPYNQRAWAGPAWPRLGCQAEEPSTTGKEVLTGSAFLVSAGAMVVYVYVCGEVAQRSRWEQPSAMC